MTRVPAPRASVVMSVDWNLEIVTPKPSFGERGNTEKKSNTALVVSTHTCFAFCASARSVDPVTPATSFAVRCFTSLFVECVCEDFFLDQVWPGLAVPKRARQRAVAPAGLTAE